MNEIIDNLFVGGIEDALADFDGVIICVLNEIPAEEPPEAVWIPFMAAGDTSLDHTAATIDKALADGRRVLVHCGSGSERAPLVVAWYLSRRRQMSLDAAYQLLKFKRPIVRDRRALLAR
jgi:protein-tyrosine phosphatase